MASRLNLHIILKSILGSENVYFQPPESMKMKYPAIIYALDDIRSSHADNGVYSSHKKYTATLLDSNPDSQYVDMLAAMPTCQFERHYTSDNLNHWLFSFYY
jgi:hypothetical protein